MWPCAAHRGCRGSVWSGTRVAAWVKQNNRSAGVCCACGAVILCFVVRYFYWGNAVQVHVEGVFDDAGLGDACRVGVVGEAVENSFFDFSGEVFSFFFSAHRPEVPFAFICC